MGKYLMKIKALVQATADDNFDPFDGNPDVAYATFEHATQSFTGYHLAVIRAKTMPPILREKYAPEEYDARMLELEHALKMQLDEAIASLKSLERMSVAYGMEPFVDPSADLNDPVFVADFVGQFMSEVYAQGIGKA